MNGATKIRELFAAKKTIVAPGAHDMLTGKIIGKLGWLCGLQPAPDARRPEELIEGFSWEKVPRGDICIPEGVF